MEPLLLRLQAQVFKWVGLFWLACGLALGNDPLGVIWRAALAALVCMIVVGVLLRMGVNHITGFLAARMAEEATEEAERARTEALPPDQRAGRPA